MGLYLTLVKKDVGISLENIRNGMILAAVIAAGKAGTGTIEKEENLMWAQGIYLLRLNFLI